MYSPVKDGVEKTVQSVRYTEASPPVHLAGLVHCFWELKTDSPLAEDFCLHALPDACVNILFNQLDPNIAGVTALRTSFVELNLGRAFHYVGIQLLPGVWRGNRAEIADSFVGTHYLGELPLVATNGNLVHLDFSAKQPVLAELVQRFCADNLIVANDITQQILTNLGAIHTVADMAAITRLSPRQLQRILKHTTGLAPHDLLKGLPPGSPLRSRCSSA